MPAACIDFLRFLLLLLRKPICISLEQFNCSICTVLLNLFHSVHSSFIWCYGDFFFTSQMCKICRKARDIRINKQNKLCARTGGGNSKRRICKHSTVCILYNSSPNTQTYSHQIEEWQRGERCTSTEEWNYNFGKKAFIMLFLQQSMPAACSFEWERKTNDFLTEVCMREKER